MHIWLFVVINCWLITKFKSNKQNLSTLFYNHEEIQVHTQIEKQT